MRPDRFRKGKGFAIFSATSGTLLSTSSAHALAYPSDIVGAAPIAIAVGALGFGVAAAILVNRWRRDGAVASHLAKGQIAHLRAQLDEAQAILEGMPELTVSWRDNRHEPQVYGPAQAVLPPGIPPEKVTHFELWAPGADLDRLRHHISELRNHGQPFEFSLTSSSGRLIRILGRVLGGAAILRLRPAQAQIHHVTDPADATDHVSTETAEHILSSLPEPAWIRDSEGNLLFVNEAYAALAGRLGVAASRHALPEIFDAQTVAAHLSGLDNAGETIRVENAFAAADTYDLVLLPLADGSAGYLRRRDDSAAARAVKALDADLSHIAGVINALSTPIAIFDGRRQLIQFNRAYCDLWNLDPDWLKPGMDEQAILDRLRTLGQLPSEVDYRAWRNEHLKSYTLAHTRETLWHLPDGRALNVVAMPAAATGGVIYVFEDLTERLALESRYNGLIHVQSETLNALGEGVAVFGTNGRLTLSNPRLAALWHLPMGKLGQHPHIDEIGAACAEAMPEDGAIIWRDLKQSIIDLNPTRTDKSGRISRADGRLLDYSTVRLPDGQTLMTFADVTEITNYQTMLKERNEALVTADRLKDAFVQNVSYELRSPLTNIIGFADLLASGQAGELNERQKSYTEYIRASSATLGVLIDNILDLTTVDAGIAELHLETQDVSQLVELARAGLSATFSASAGDMPVNLKVDIADDLPAFVADGTRIVQILYNLLSNAARFSDPGAEIHLTISGRGGNRILFVVEDEGAGISEDMRAAMFQRFEGQSVDGRQRGTGLGLAIVKAFVNLHGGTIEIEGRKPKGTRVTVNLPAIASAATTAAE